MSFRGTAATAAAITALSSQRTVVISFTPALSLALQPDFALRLMGGSGRVIERKLRLSSGILRSLDFYRGGIEAEGVQACPNLGHLPCCRWIADICHDRQSAKAGNDFAQEFDSLAGEVDRLHRQSGDVAAGRARLATRPLPTGSDATAKTIGIFGASLAAAHLRAS